MVGSTGERMLRLTLPHVDAWNIWFADFGNIPGGLHPHLERVDRIATELVATRARSNARLRSWSR